MSAKKISDLPDLEKIENEIIAEERKTTEEVENKQVARGRKKIFRIVILSLLFIALAMTGITLLQSARGTQYNGLGSISGSVVNAESTPIPAEISVLNSSLITTADEAGNFQLNNVPAGPADVIVAWQGQGVEVPVVVLANGNVTIGEVTIESTKLPGE
jgi:hypothetical protein